MSKLCELVRIDTFGSTRTIEITEKVDTAALRRAVYGRAALACSGGMIGR
jgi:hypothetical protein